MHIFAILTQLMGLTSVVAAKSYFTLTLHAPEYAALNGKVINARDRSFIIGAQSPSTRCDLNDPAQCPTGESTLVNDDMSFLAVSLATSKSLCGPNVVYFGVEGYSNAIHATCP